MINFYYDPQRQGYDTTLWKTVTGTPTVSSNKLRLTQAAIAHYGDCLRGETMMRLNIPEVPTADDVRTFGFASLNGNSGVTFDIIDTYFVATAYKNGAQMRSLPLVFAAGWEDTDTDFKIMWEAGLARFFVNGVEMAVLSDGITYSAMVDAGTGYVAGDLITVDGANDNAVLRVDTVGGGGEIATVTLISSGTGYSATTYATTTNGSGEGATVAMKSLNVIPSDPLSLYANNANNDNFDITLITVETPSYI